MLVCELGVFHLRIVRIDISIKVHQGRIQTLRWGPGFGLLALPAFLPSVISSFFTQNKGGGGAGPPGPLYMSRTLFL